MELDGQESTDVKVARVDPTISPHYFQTMIDPSNTSGFHRHGGLLTYDLPMPRVLNRTKVIKLGPTRRTPSPPINLPIAPLRPLRIFDIKRDSSQVNRLEVTPVEEKPPPFPFICQEFTCDK